MPSFTPRAQLIKTAGPEKQNVGNINDSFDKIDNLLGAQSVTSTTRPSTPFDGQIIWEADTQRVYIWRAGTPGRWQYISGPVRVFPPSGALTLVGGAAWAVVGSAPEVEITESGQYQVALQGVYDFSVPANFFGSMAVNFWLDDQPWGISGGLALTAPSAGTITRVIPVEMVRSGDITIPGGATKATLRVRGRADTAGGTQVLKSVGLQVTRIS